MNSGQSWRCCYSGKSVVSSGDSGPAQVFPTRSARSCLAIACPSLRPHSSPPLPRNLSPRNAAPGAGVTAVGLGLRPSVVVW